MYDGGPFVDALRERDVVLVHVYCGSSGGCVEEVIAVVGCGEEYSVGSSCSSSTSVGMDGCECIGGVP